MNIANRTASIGLRLAALMDRENIESLPRNYELLYDVYSGSIPELTREFMALGSPKTQKMLDELGRKYVPHQHEEGVLAKANGAMRSQMDSFLQLIRDESSSLAEFEKAIDEANRAIRSDNGLDRAAIAKSIDKLSKATVQQAQTNKSLSNAAAVQNAAISQLKKEMESVEAQKWTEPVTGLANRRSFNKTVVSVYANPKKPAPCGLVFAELDDFQNFSANGEFPFTNQYLREIAGFFKSANTSKQYIAYLDKGRFAVLLNTADPDQIAAFTETLRNVVSARKPLVSKRNSSKGEITLSFGIAMATSASSAHELIEHAETALGDSIRAGGNKVMLHAMGELQGSEKNWTAYSRSGT